ncbi:hypothetical protein GYMLUDRAFT_61710 [Collybiopsis luxurians FD-317 M1]|uniref:Uncharacterized protein n=1 Tax=Collybiopsis luxurians FD-317 M1 TaxID=944289 RepID=A0A0D0CNI9_9AGAR|nr:hypothetical protein GYMLUDRAFT_61710 [Collybiopsis luxurians FD-317 M1]
MTAQNKVRAQAFEATDQETKVKIHELFCQEKAAFQSKSEDDGDGDEFAPLTADVFEESTVSGQNVFTANGKTWRLVHYHPDNSTRPTEPRPNLSMGAYPEYTKKVVAPFIEFLQSVLEPLAGGANSPSTNTSIEDLYTENIFVDDVSAEKDGSTKDSSPKDSSTTVNLSDKESSGKESGNEESGNEESGNEESGDNEEDSSEKESTAASSKTDNSSCSKEPSGTPSIIEALGVKFLDLNFSSSFEALSSISNLQGLEASLTGGIDAVLTQFGNLPNSYKELHNSSGDDLQKCFCFDFTQFDQLVTSNHHTGDALMDQLGDMSAQSNLSVSGGTMANHFGHFPAQGHPFDSSPMSTQNLFGVSTGAGFLPFSGDAFSQANFMDPSIIRSGLSSIRSSFPHPGQSFMQSGQSLIQPVGQSFFQLGHSQSGQSFFQPGEPFSQTSRSFAQSQNQTNQPFAQPFSQSGLAFSGTSSSIPIPNANVHYSLQRYLYLITHWQFLYSVTAPNQFIPTGDASTALPANFTINNTYSGINDVNLKNSGFNAPMVSSDNTANPVKATAPAKPKKKKRKADYLGAGADNGPKDAKRKKGEATPLPAVEQPQVVMPAALSDRSETGNQAYFPSAGTSY